MRSSRNPDSEGGNDIAVSPVIGVMLLLVVTIIVAAVVSGFSGGLMKGNEKTPELVMEVTIQNNGYHTGSSFSARVTGVEKAIPTRDVKITTQWSKVLTNGTRVTGGATVLPLVNNTFVHYGPSQGCSNENDYNYTSPWGYGTGVGEGDGKYGRGSGGSPKDSRIWFGNYDLTIGTTMWAQPFGAAARPTAGGYSAYNVGYGCNGSKWSYVYGTHSCADFYEDVHTDQMQALLGHGWEILQAGDKVAVTFTHIPTGKIMWQKDVIVEA